VPALAANHPERVGYIMGHKIRIFELTKPR
jgi:hypothetical protein